VNTRKAQFAGSWYPAHAEECRRQIRTFGDLYPVPDADSGDWVGGIVPHAGWVYSGGIASSVIRAISGTAVPDVVVVFGMHMRPNQQPRLMTRGSWETPLGDIPVETSLAAALADQFEFSVDQPGDFNRDNTIELQTPLIKHFFQSAAMVPIGVPPTAAATDIGRAVSLTARRLGLQLVVLGSTDLTHYGPNYGFSPAGSGARALGWVRDVNDRKMVEAILGMDSRRIVVEGLENQNACCSGAAAAAVAAAAAMGARTPQLVAYATSAERIPGESFVGYAGILF